MDILSKRDRGYLMEHLTDGLPEETIQAIKHAESVLCVVFNYQTSYGTERCFKLRKALVDLCNAARDKRMPQVSRN